MKRNVYVTLADVLQASMADERDLDEALFVAIGPRGELLRETPGRGIRGLVQWDDDPKSAHDLVRAVLLKADSTGRVLWPRDFRDRPSDDGRRICFAWVGELLTRHGCLPNPRLFDTAGDFSGAGLG